MSVKASLSFTLLSLLLHVCQGGKTAKLIKEEIK